MSELQDFILANPGGKIPLELAKQIATADEVILYYIHGMSTVHNIQMWFNEPDNNIRVRDSVSGYANIQLYCLIYAQYCTITNYFDMDYRNIFDEPCDEIEIIWHKIRDMKLYGSDLHRVLLNLELRDPVLAEYIEQAKNRAPHVKSARKV